MGIFELGWSLVSAPFTGESVCWRTNNDRGNDTLYCIAYPDANSAGVPSETQKLAQELKPPQYLRDLAVRLRDASDAEAVKLKREIGELFNKSQYSRAMDQAVRILKTRVSASGPKVVVDEEDVGKLVSATTNATMFQRGLSLLNDLAKNKDSDPAAKVAAGKLLKDGNAKNPSDSTINRICELGAGQCWDTDSWAEARVRLTKELKIKEIPANKQIMEKEAEEAEEKKRQANFAKGEKLLQALSKSKDEAEKAVAEELLVPIKGKNREEKEAYRVALITGLGKGQYDAKMRMAALIKQKRFDLDYGEGWNFVQQKSIADALQGKQLRPNEKQAILNACKKLEENALKQGEPPEFHKILVDAGKGKTPEDKLRLMQENEVFQELVKQEEAKLNLAATKKTLQGIAGGGAGITPAQRKAATDCLRAWDVTNPTTKAFADDIGQKPEAERKKAVLAHDEFKKVVDGAQEAIDAAKKKKRIDGRVEAAKTGMELLEQIKAGQRVGGHTITKSEESGAKKILAFAKGAVDALKQGANDQDLALGQQRALSALRKYGGLSKDGRLRVSDWMRLLNYCNKCDKYVRNQQYNQQFAFAPGNMVLGQMGGFGGVGFDYNSIMQQYYQSMARINQQLARFTRANGYQQGLAFHPNAALAFQRGLAG